MATVFSAFLTNEKLLQICQARFFFWAVLVTILFTLPSSIQGKTSSFASIFSDLYTVEDNIFINPCRQNDSLALVAIYGLTDRIDRIKSCDLLQHTCIGSCLNRSGCIKKLSVKAYNKFLFREPQSSVCHWSLVLLW